MNDDNVTEEELRILAEAHRHDELTSQLSDISEKFRLSIWHSRCYLCEDKIADQRWQLGEYVSGNKEIVHTACWEEEAERAASEVSYWCGSFPETYTAESRVPLGDTRCGWTPDGNGSGSGQPAGKAETNPCADVLGVETLAAFAASEGLSPYAGEHGDRGDKRDAEGSRPPIHVAGCRGPDPVRLPERLIPFEGDNNVTVRVPRALKAMLAASVTDEPIKYQSRRVLTDKIARAMESRK